MKVYLVGGAVRDKLLGYPSQEKDWVVVGAAPNTLLDLGYKKVGRDFPVFLHPETNEEYALARTERKTSAGYHGFVCYYEPTVTLEEDLLRRDLTINAMAMVNGELIDPYGGQRDLQAKILRHVSPAFTEDPLRVLRVARFAARYYHLGFTIAAPTLQLMRQIVGSGELEYVSKERIWQELSKSLLDKNPEIFICTLRACGALEKIFPEIDKLFGVPATAFYHQEIDTGVHTLMVLNRACKLSAKLHIRFAALVHDLGKAEVPMLNWPSQKGHEDLGCKVIQNMCTKYRLPSKIRKFAVLVSKLHLRIHKVRDLTADEIVDTLEFAGAWRDPQTFLDLLTVAKADSLGRGLLGDYPEIAWFFPQQNALQEDDYTQINLWQEMLEVCKNVRLNSQSIKHQSGQQIRQALRAERCENVKLIQQAWNLHEK